MHCAAANGQVVVCRYLLGPEVNGVNLNSVCQHGNTALHLAANNGKEKVLDCLLQSGAELDSKNFQDFVMFHAL